MAGKDLNDLLWSVDRTVRSVLDSQEMKNLGNDIRDSLNRAGEDIADSLKNIGNQSPKYDRKPPYSSWENKGRSSRDFHDERRYTHTERRTYRNYRTDYRPPKAPEWNRPVSPGWNQPGRGEWRSHPLSQMQSAAPYRGKIIKREPNFKRAAPLAMTLIGYSGALYSFLSGGGWVLDRLLGTASWSGFPWILFYTAWTIGFLTLGVLGTAWLGGKNKMRRIWQYLKGRDFCKISEISQKLRLSDKKTVRLVEKMIGKKMLPEGHFDETKTCLMLTDETYTRYLESQQAEAEAQRRRKEAEEDPQKAALAQVVQEGSRYIRRIREINNDLPDPVITAKLDDLEKVCQQIFAYVTDHPDKLSAIRKFISYYLPTTLKLLEAYRKLVHQDTGVESEEKTEQEILAALDNINLAFHNLLDELMQDDYLDLSADISVLQSMLSQEGLVDDFSVPDQPEQKEEEEPAQPQLHI